MGVDSIVLKCDNDIKKKKILTLVKKKKCRKINIKCKFSM